MKAGRLLPGLALALGACGGGSGGFELTLSPRFLDDRLLVDGPDVELVVRRPGADPEVMFLGEGKKGEALEIPTTAPFEEGTTVGLLLEESGGTENEWDPGATIAYGQATVGADLAQDGGELEVLVPRVGAIASLGNLASARRRIGAAMAMAPDGTAYLFGGTTPDGGAQEASREIAKLSGLNSGNFKFDTINQGLPSETMMYLPITGGYYDPLVEGKFAARVFATATPVIVDGMPKILVFGGRYALLNPTGLHERWLLFDPASEAIEAQGSAADGRAEHLAIPFRSGKVLIYGGFIGTGEYIPSFPTYEIWDPATKKSRAGEDGTGLVGFLHAFGAPMGEEVAVCGGLQFSIPDDVRTWTPQARCYRFLPNDRVQTLPDLPVPLAGAAMVELSDGDLLVTGGFSDTLEEISSAPIAPAVGEVYRLSGDTWSEVGQLRYARTHHAMIPLADGRVLVIGGTTGGSFGLAMLDEPVRCAELYDPADDSLTKLDCGATGQGAHPTWGSTPGGGAVIVEGWTAEGYQIEGGAAYGITSLGPPL